MMGVSLCVLVMRHPILLWYVLLLSVGCTGLLQFLGEKPYQSQHQCDLVGIVLSHTLPCASWTVVLLWQMQDSPS